MGETSSRELSNDGHPCRLRDLSEQLQSVMMDLLQERQTEDEIAEKREELERDKQQQNQEQAAMMHDGGGGGASPASSTGGGGDHHHHAERQDEADELFAPRHIPTLGVAVELRTKSQAETGETLENLHRVWIALTLPGVGLCDAGAQEAANALSVAANLEFLDIGYNEIGPHGMQHLCPAIAESSAGKECLRFLRLSGNQFGQAPHADAAGRASPSALAQLEQQSARGNSSDASNANNGNSVAPARATTAPAETAPSVGVTALAQLLATASALQELQLFNCGITDSGVHAIVNSLRAHDAIRVINLAGNPTTRKSIVMLTELVKRCKTLLNVNVDAAVTKTSDYQALEDALEVNRAEARRKEEARAVLEAKARRREQQQLAEAAQREEQSRHERAVVEARIREIEAARQQQEEDVRRLEALASEKEAATRARKEAQRAAQSDAALEKAMTQAYEFREKIGVATGKARIFRDGFSLYTRQVAYDEQGAYEIMVPYERNPKRLKACWCDPPDAAVPYARKLHYHCKHESASIDLVGAATAAGGGAAASGAGGGGAGADASRFGTAELPQYQGCRGTGHACSSVGYYTKSLPNRSAAHFFSSQHPSYAEEDEMDEQQHMHGAGAGGGGGFQSF